MGREQKRRGTGVGEGKEGKFLSQAIAFYVTFRLQARGRLVDLLISLLKKNHGNLLL